MKKYKPYLEIAKLVRIQSKLDAWFKDESFRINEFFKADNLRGKSIGEGLIEVINLLEMLDHGYNYAHFGFMIYMTKDFLDKEYIKYKGLKDAFYGERERAKGEKTKEQITNAIARINELEHDFLKRKEGYESLLKDCIEFTKSGPKYRN